MAAIDGQYETNGEAPTPKPREPVSSKDLGDLRARVLMLVSQVEIDHDTISALRRDVSRLKDQVTSLEQHIYSIKNAIR